MIKALALFLATTLLAAPLYAQDPSIAVSGNALPPAKANPINTKEAPPTNATSGRWEYKIVTADDNFEEAERLNALGVDRWELVTVTYLPKFRTKTKTEGAVNTGEMGPHLRYYFRRSLP